MSEEDIKIMIKFIREKVERETSSAVARKIGCSNTYIHNILTGKTIKIAENKQQLILHAYPELKKMINADTDDFSIKDGNLHWNGLVIENIHEKLADYLRKLKNKYSYREISSQTQIGEAIINGFFNRKSYNISESNVILAVRNCQDFRKHIGLNDSQSQIMVNSPQGIQVGAGASYHVENKIDISSIVSDIKRYLFEVIMKLDIEDEPKMCLMKIIAYKTFEEEISKIIKGK